MLAFLNVVRCFLIIMLCGLLPVAGHAGEPRDSKTRNEKTVSLQVVDVPLNEVLDILAKSIPMDIRGTVPSHERVTVRFSDLTLEEALSRIMRGYNYVLVRPDESARALLVVMNKIEPTTRREPASVATVPAAPVPAPGTMPVQGGQPRPGIQQTPTGQRQGATPPVIGPTATGDVAQPGPGFPVGAPDSSVPPGPGAAPSDTPPGANPPSSPGAGGLPSRPFALPRTSNPPPEGAGRSASQPVLPDQSQEPAQSRSEPIKVMTPFGERSNEPTDTGPRIPAQATQQPVGPTPAITAPATMAPQGQP
jgi:hypothetical protein